ncbi:MAG: hypothetical protein HY690_04710 [Chloroflexi bacterium]|nr:hypothetical protein [Chloroflexota bacterium]
MENQVYTLGVWRVKPGQETAFVAAWKELGAFFMSLPEPPEPPGTLVQSLDDPQLFYSFGPWKSLEAIQAMRADPRTPAMIRQLAALCSEARPGNFRLVATVP